MTILLFSQDKCTPCSQLSRWMINNKIPFTRLDVFVDTAEFHKYGVMSTPTVVVLDGSGKEIHRAVGLVPSITLTRLIGPEVVTH